MKKIVLLVVPLMSLVLSSCATIVSDSDYPVSIQSFPSDTEFMIKDEDQNIVHSGRTPNVTTLKAGDDYFSKAHYTIEYVNEDKKVQKMVTPEIDNWYWGNILFGGVIGLFIVDPITGAMYKLPEKVTADVHSLYPNGKQERRIQTPSASAAMPFNQNINVTVNVNDGKTETKAADKKAEKVEVKSEEKTEAKQ